MRALTLLSLCILAFLMVGESIYLSSEQVVPNTPADLSSAEADESTPWRYIADPYGYADDFWAPLFREFGDTPAVHIVGNGFLKAWLQEPMDGVEKTQFNQALAALWPRSRFETVPSSEPFLNLKVQFPDLEPFVKQYGFLEGLQKFAEQYPERALEFKRALLQTDEGQSGFEAFPEEAKEFFLEGFPEEGKKLFDDMPPPTSGSL